MAENVKGCTAVTLAFDLIKPEKMKMDKSPVIFIHGITGSRGVWEDIPRFIADKTKRKVYNVDSRDHGDSDRSELYNSDVNCADLLHFMDENGIPRAVLVGHSMGGYTAYMVALKAPERVEKILVEDMGVKQLPQSILDFLLKRLQSEKSSFQHVPAGLDEAEAKRWVVLQLRNAASGDMMKKLYDPDNQVGMLEIRHDAVARRHVFKTNYDVLVRAVEDAGTLLTPLTGVYEGPACVVYGKDSPFRVGKDEEEIKMLFPKAKMVEMATASHNVHRSCPQEFKEVLRTFIATGN